MKKDHQLEKHLNKIKHYFISLIPIQIIIKLHQKLISIVKNKNQYQLMLLLNVIHRNKLLKTNRIHKL